MSIINDALKKVQKSIEKNPPAPKVPFFPTNQNSDTNILPLPRIPKLFLDSPRTKAPQNPQIQPKLNRSSVASAMILPHQKKQQKILIALCGSICTILIFLTGYLFYLFGTTHPAAIVKPVEPKKVAKISESIVLQGIMKMDDKNVALINDDIYEVGESVRGKKILSIAIDNVQIQDHRKVKTLYVKKKPN